MWFNKNGYIVQQASFTFDNRSFRYGDGLFESMRVFNGKIFNRNHMKIVWKRVWIFLDFI